MGRTYLRDLRRGMTVSEIYLVETANFKQARNGSNFIQLVLRDSSGSVKALRWESNPDEFRRLERNPFLLTSGRVEEYQGNLQIVVDEMTSLSVDDAHVRPEEFLPTTTYDIPAMAAELDQFIESIPDNGIRSLVQKVLERPGLREGLQMAPAGKVMHHAYVGGLLEHVLSLTKLANRVLEHYPWLDRSMLIAGAVLHDIGKVEELSYHTGFSYSDEGQLVGHIVMATTWIDNAATSLGDAVPLAKVRELKHIILSHHGKLEFGSPKTPMTPEAVVLHYLDNVDAKLAGFLDAFRNVRPQSDGDRWSEFNHMFGTRIYFPTRLDESVKQLPEGPTPGGSSDSEPPDPEPPREATTGDLPFS